LMNNAISGRSPSFSPREFNDVCMTLPGGGCRLQTCRGLAAQWFDSTLRTLDGTPTARPTCGLLAFI